MGCRYSTCTDEGLGGTQKIFDLEASELSSEKSTKPSFDFINRTKAPFQAIRAAAKGWLRRRPNYSELMETLSTWESRVYSQLESTIVLAEDLHSTVSIDSSNSTFTLFHEVDGIRVAPLVAAFCSAVQGSYVLTKVPPFDAGACEAIEEFLLSLRPLTYSFYLSLGNSIDCGVGVTKPMDHRELARFLKSAGDHEGLARWTYEVQPVSTSFSFSFLSSAKTCTFYVFGGEKKDNYSKAISLFECNGAPMSEAAVELLSLARSEEASASVTLDDDGVVSMGVEVKGLEPLLSVELARLLDPRFEESQWRKMEDLGDGLLTEVQLRKEGWILRQTASVS